MSHRASRQLHFTLFTIATGFGVLGFGTSADACSCADETGFYETTPVDGAVDVPTNVTLFATVAYYPGTVTLLDEQDEEVATVRTFISEFSGVCSNRFELDPAVDLLPNHTYRLVASGDDAGAGVGLPRVISFTTGGGASEPDQVSAPKARLAVFTTQAVSSCGESALQACLDMEDGVDVEVQVKDQDETRRYVETSNGMNHIDLGAPEGEVCVLVHTRDLAGNLSEPFEQCFDVDDVYALRSEDAWFEDVCASREVQALLNGEVPIWGDAGPTSQPLDADGGRVYIPDSTDDGLDTDVEPQPDVVTDGNDPTPDSDAAVIDTEAEPDAVDSGAPGKATGRDPSGVEKNATTTDSSDSGCSVTAPRNHGASTSLGMLLAAFAVVFGRRTSRRK